MLFIVNELRSVGRLKWERGRVSLLLFIAKVMKNL